MNKTTDFTGVGFVLIFFGVLAGLTGKAGYTRYGHAEGDKARYIGIVMIIFGISLLIPKLRSMMNKRK